MRTTFGLVSLLVAVGIIVWAFSKTDVPAAREGKKSQDQAAQVSGRGPDGQAAAQSLKVTPQEKNGKAVSLLVTEVAPGGAADAYYHLKAGDVIVKLGQFDVRDNPLGADETAVAESVRKNEEIVVQRDGRQLTLAPTGSPLAAPGAGNPVSIPMH